MSPETMNRAAEGRTTGRYLQPDNQPDYKKDGTL